MSSITGNDLVIEWNGTEISGSLPPTIPSQDYELTLQPEEPITLIASLSVIQLLEAIEVQTKVTGLVEFYKAKTNGL